MPTEADAIAATPTPGSVASLSNDLRELGVASGTVTIVHSAMSKLGWVAGGARSVVEALLAVVGPSGTIVMPTQSGQLSDPVNWNSPPVPAAWIEDVRASLPAYDPHLTPTRGMGQIVEAFRQLPATQRSPHPLVSFAAHGPHAEQIVGEHPVSPNCGETSPLARMYELDARVLLLGVDYANNTSLHLAEYRAEWPGKQAAFGDESAPVLVDGERQWMTWRDLEGDDEDFGMLGEAFAASGAERSGPVGAGVGRLCSQREVVDFGVSWLSAHRH